MHKLSQPPRSCSLLRAPDFALCRAPRPKLASFRYFRLHPVLLSATRPRFCSLPCAPPQIGFVPQIPAPPGFALCYTSQVLLSAVCPAPNWLRSATSGSTRFCSLLHVPGLTLCRVPRPKLASFRNFRPRPVLLSPARPRFCSPPRAPPQIGFVPQLPAPAARPVPHALHRAG
jgi:hypothetical protein